jgi:hypothetical protein
VPEPEVVPELVLEYGRPVRRAETARLVGGVLATAGFLAVYFIGLQAGPQVGSAAQAVLELVALVCVAFAGWALPGAIEGVTAGREVWYESGPVLRLTRNGLEFRTRDGGPVVVATPWELVERCEFRPALGGDPRWCVALSFAATWSGMVPWNQVDARAAELARTWRTLGAAVDRRLLRDALVFGTPIVIDLTRCSGVSVAELDAAVRGWTFGQCGCDPTARPTRRAAGSSPWSRKPDDAAQRSGDG